MNIGMFLQYLGVIIAVFGFIVAGKTGHSDFQVPALVIGIIISVIGFLKYLGTPVQEQKNERVLPQYETKAEKNWAFLKAALYHALLIIIMPLYFNSDDFDFLAEYPLLFFIPLLMYALLLIGEARTIYRK